MLVGGVKDGAFQKVAPYFVGSEGGTSCFRKGGVEPLRDRVGWRFIGKGSVFTILLIEMKCWVACEWYSGALSLYNLQVGRPCSCLIAVTLDRIMLARCERDLMGVVWHRARGSMNECYDLPVI